VGRAWFSGQTPLVPFIFRRGRFEVIELVGTEEAVVTATVWDINDVGTISGWFAGEAGRQRGFLARPIR
jgi:hypothetical protein